MTYDEPRARHVAALLAAGAQRLHGVQAVALSSALPSRGGDAGVALASAELGLSGTPRTWPVAQHVVASPEVFAVLGIRLRRGRGFTPADTMETTAVTVISEATAKRLFGDTDPLGRDLVMRRELTMRQGPDADETRRVVGITADVDTGAAVMSSTGVVFVPFAQRYETALCVIARTDGDPTSLVGGLRNVAARVDAELAVIDAGTGVSLAGPTNLMMQVMAGLSGLLGTLALILALVGLNGVLSHVVTARPREVGVRVALGADRGRIIRMILRDGASPVVVGIFVGLAFGAMVRLSMRPLFVRMLPTMDVAVLVMVPALFVGSALVACYLPARRAARVDPNVALRHL